MSNKSLLYVDQLESSLIVHEGHSIVVYASILTAKKEPTLLTMNLVDSNEDNSVLLTTFPLQLTIPAGQTSGVFNFPTQNNPVFTGDRKFSLTIEAPSLNAQQIINIEVKDLQIPPGIALTQISQLLNEGDGTGSATLEMSHPSSKPISVSYSFDHQTANADDYQGLNGEVTFLPGEVSKTINFTLLDDSDLEITETFLFKLDAIDGTATINPSATTQVISIIDNESSTLSVANAVALEGNQISFNVMLIPAPVTPVTVDYSTSDISALAGTHYTMNSGTLTFNPGETSKIVTINTTPNLSEICAPDRSFQFSLSNPQGAVTIGNFSANGTIIDPDLPIISINNAAGIEGQPIFHSVSLNQACSTKNVSFDFATSSGTALSGTDFALVASTATIAAGSLTTNITITTLQDLLYEGEENYTVSISSPVNATLGSASATGTIQDDERSTLSLSDATAIEGTPATFIISLNPAALVPVTVDFATINGTASNGTHYTGQSGRITFVPGETSKTISISTLANGSEVCAADRTFSLALSNPQGAAEIGTSAGTGTIIDPDVPEITIADASGAEGAVISHTVSLSQACPTKTISFNASSSSGTATSGSDFTLLNSNFTIIPGSLNTTVSVSSLQDTIFEGNETFSVTLSAPVNATINRFSALATIIDDEAQPTVYWSVASQSRNENDGTINITATLSHATTQNVSLPFTLSGTGTQGSDYTISASPLTIPALSLSANVAVTIIDDANPESNETVILTMGSPSNATASGVTVHTLTIIDNDSIAAITNVTSTKTNGLYNTGNVDIQITFDYPVTVTGTPQLTLNTNPTQTANFLTGSGTSTLTFRYIITSGDSSNDLDYSSTTALNGGTMMYSGIPVNRTLPAPGGAGSLGLNKNIAIDAEAPSAPSNLVLGPDPQKNWRTPTLSWTNGIDPQGPVTHQMSVYRASNNSSVKSWTTATSGDYANVTGLQEGTAYYIRVRAVDNAGNIGPFAQSVNWTVTLPTEANVGGYSWRIASSSTQNCNDVCSLYGGVHPATRTFAGSHGSDTNCGAVIQGLGKKELATSSANNTAMGCYSNTSSGAFRGTQPTSYTDTDPTTMRVCACNTGSAPQGNPSEITNLSVMDFHYDSMTLIWKSSGTYNYDFLIAYAIGSTPPTDCSGAQITSINMAPDDMGTVSHIISGLDSDTEYSFRVCAHNGESIPVVTAGQTLTARTQLRDDDALARAPIHVGSTSRDMVYATSQTYPHTVQVGPDRFLLVNIAKGPMYENVNPTSVTYAGLPLQLLARHYASEQWYLKNPPEGVANISIQFSENTMVTSAASSFEKVNQAEPFSILKNRSGSWMNPEKRIIVLGSQDQLLITSSYGLQFKYYNASPSLLYVSNSTYDFRMSEVKGRGMLLFDEIVSSGSYVEYNVLALQPAQGPRLAPRKKSYFVLSQSYNGNLGDLTGADARCRTDLMANSWLGKSEVDLNTANIRSFLCNSSTCNNLRAFTPYAFAVVNQPAVGGKLFLTSFDGTGPGYNFSWYTSETFGGSSSVSFWTNRSSINDMYWGTTPLNTTAALTCSNFTSTAGNAMRGWNLYTDRQRWAYSNSSCVSSIPYVCIVDPQ